MPHPLSGQRVAVVMMSSIGDVVNALPVAVSLKHAAPGVQLSWVIQPDVYPLIAEHPAIDDFLFFHRKEGWRAFPRFLRESRGREFDLVLDPHVYFKAGVVTGILRAPRKVGLNRARAPDLNWLFTNEKLPPRPVGHILDQQLEFVEYLGVPARIEWQVGPTAEECARYAGLLPTGGGPVVAICLASSRLAKDWPAERYAELAGRVHAELGGSIVVVGAPSAAEEAAMAVVRRKAAHPPLDLRAWDLRRLVYLLNRADVVVSPDSAALHLGVAVGTPTVALMGYTNPKRVGPIRFRELLVDGYGEPGENYPADAGYRPGRMERVSVDQVLAKVALAIDPPSRTG
ncbi:MAG: glycosyltransferase family 9 protein [Longimicrobiaceae bacterium]